MPHIIVHPEEIPCLIHQSLLHWFQVTWKSWLVWLQYSGNPCQCQKCFISALQHKQLYIAVTWTVWGVASFVEYRLPVFVLGTSLKSSTFWCLGESNVWFQKPNQKVGWYFCYCYCFLMPTGMQGTLTNRLKCRMINIFILSLFNTTSKFSLFHIPERWRLFLQNILTFELTSAPHSRKMKGIHFPELPMMTSSGKALHSYPSMSIFKITCFASIVAWL